ncbi:alpha-amylase [Acrasis kona]|uniref:alpha-amylase n=1 Tax=Acrasis kona TaxID=1008807 RepID=A0AAW2Z844_9EUKA
MNPILSLSLLAVVAYVTGKNAEQWRHRTIYQIITDRFSQGTTSGNSCDLHNYCGGTFKGIENNLDYIQNMGFTAIWISPVVQNIEGGYHGYWANNFFKVNQHFGTEQDLKDLVSECHKRDIYVMVDIVLNHVGPIGTDFGQISDFNQESYYHSRCQVVDYNNQYQVEHCRLADLPDLNQENDFVSKKIMDSVVWLTNTFDIDGLRIDTIPFISKDFWAKFKKECLVGKLNDIYVVGEVLNGDIAYVAPYANILGATLNYPLYFSIKSSYGQRQSMYNIRSVLNAEPSQFKHVEHLGTFVDNHDNSRFLNDFPDVSNFKNALTFQLFSKGIPIVYYGSEQLFNGGADPYNRETLWNHFNTNSEMYNFFKILVAFRKAHIDEIVTSDHVERYISDEFYAFSRGKVFIATTNVGSSYARVQHDVTYHPYDEGTLLCDLFYPTDCVKIENGEFTVVLLHGESKVFYPKSLM